ncbi:MAG: hypothetical protein HQM10_24925 [Candidatus Riflebacteria bacterium]|nr:hypothetical protein [Candidatus Riflebacteria bacterium]
MQNRILIVSFLILSAIWMYLLVFRSNQNAIEDKKELPQDLTNILPESFLTSGAGTPSLLLPDEIHAENPSNTLPLKTKHIPILPGRISPVNELSPADIEALKVAQEKIDNFEKENVEARKNFILSQINNPNLATETRELYRLRLCQSFRDGKSFAEKNDFSMAETSFLQMLSDSSSTPIMKGIALKYLANCARELSNPEKYFDYLQQLGELQSKEDLTAIGLEKNTNFFKWIKDQRRYYQAMNDFQKRSVILLYLVEEKKMAQEKAQKYFDWKINQIREDLKCRSKITN